MKFGLINLCKLYRALILCANVLLVIIIVYMLAEGGKTSNYVDQPIRFDFQTDITLPVRFYRF